MFYSKNKVLRTYILVIDLERFTGRKAYYLGLNSPKDKISSQLEMTHLTVFLKIIIN